MFKKTKLSTGLMLAFGGSLALSGLPALAQETTPAKLDRVEITGSSIKRIEGEGVDAELMRSYISAWDSGAGNSDAYAVSHVGYGLNAAARWDAMALYDKRDFNGTELRAFAGNFLYSTGANEVARRHTRGHVDLPLRGCTVRLDGTTVVDAGVLVE